jgi:hypothetical protein
MRGFRALKKSPSEQALEAWQASDNIVTTQGYTSFPIQIHPNDRYVRVFPEGPYTQAWEGVQKINAVASVGKLRTAIYNPNGMANPFQTSKMAVPVVGNNVWGPGSIGTGPAIYGADPNYGQADYSAPYQSLVSRILAKLRG